MRHKYILIISALIIVLITMVFFGRRGVISEFKIYDPPINLASGADQKFDDIIWDDPISVTLAGLQGTNEKRVKMIFHEREWDYIDSRNVSGDPVSGTLPILKERASKVFNVLSFKYTSIDGMKVAFVIGRDMNIDYAYIEALVESDGKLRKTMTVSGYGSDIREFIETGISGKIEEIPMDSRYYEEKLRGIRERLLE